jgi:hypothetical protein
MKEFINSLIPPRQLGEYGKGKAAKLRSMKSACRLVLMEAKEAI